MNASRKKASSTTHDICLIVLTILFVVSVFFFIAILSHSALGSEDTGSKVPVVNNIAIWTKKIIDAGAEDIGKIELILKGPPREVHTYLPTVAPTHTPVVLNLRGTKKVPPAAPDNSPPDTISSGMTVGTTIPYHELSCPHGELLTFWQRTTAADQKYESPFLHSGPPVKYVTFEPDVGGWNNIRMQMELVIVFAYATGRTLVLPPDQPMYLLNKGKGHQKAHSFADFFPFDYINQRMSVISMEEFMRREAVSGQLRNSSTHKVEFPPGNKTEFNGEEKTDRLAMWDYLRSVGSCPPWKALNEFVVIPVAPGVNVSHLPPARAKVYADKRELFGAKRYAQYYDEHWQQQKLIHFISKPGMGYRLLEHFYTFIHFEDDAMDRYYKRFVRDYVHYIDIIFCKAAKIINKLLEEGGGSYSSFHVRRGEFQYKEVKIPADRMLHNVGQFIPKGQLLFIATDEHNKSFFDPFLKRFPKIHYLDDFMDYAELRDINPNFLGMIDQVICTRGEVFVGTWFSTFTGYITRMRGYMGYSDKLTYFGDMAHRDRYQQFEQPKFPFYMREWNTSWHQIDVV